MSWSESGSVGKVTVTDLASLLKLLDESLKLCF